MNLPLHSDIRAYWKSMGTIIGGILLFASLPLLLKMGRNPEGFILIGFLMAACMSVLAWCIRPRQLNLTHEAGFIQFTDTNGRVTASYPLADICGMSPGPYGSLLKHDLIWITISSHSKDRKIGPFLFTNGIGGILDETLEDFLEGAKASRPAAPAKTNGDR